MTDCKVIVPPSSAGKEYNLISKINEGRYSNVYLGTSKSDGNNPTPVAIKIPKEEYLAKERQKRVVNETYFLKQATHPQTITYLDHSFDREQPYLVMEYVPDTILNLFKENAVTQEVVTDYLTQITEFLTMLNTKKISHRDIKCSNLGYTERQVKVLDFGLAIPLTQSVITNSTEIPSYNSPETRDFSIVTPSSDTYSAGKALEFMLIGELADSSKEALDNIEFYYDISLPDSFKEMFTSMTHEDLACRANPNELRELVAAAIEDLQKKTYFTPEMFVLINQPSLILSESSLAL